MQQQKHVSYTEKGMMNWTWIRKGGLVTKDLMGEVGGEVEVDSERRHVRILPRVGLEEIRR